MCKKMKLIIGVFLTSFLITIYAQYDINVEEILNNKRLLDAYSRCYLDKGPCPGPARESKSKFIILFFNKTIS